MGCGEHKHPLQRGGVSQADRFLAGLEADYVLVDEKNLADWIVYAEQLSASVKFYNLDNQAAPGSNWKAFFGSDISASLAFVAGQDTEALSGIAARLTALRADANQGNAPLLKQNLGELFGAALTFAKSLDDLIGRLPATSPLRLVTNSLIQTKLAKTIERLIAYFKAAQLDVLVSGGSVAGWRIFGRPVSDAQTIIAGSLSAAWITGGAATWNAYASGIASDASIYGDPTGTEAQKIRHAGNHNLFASLFDQILSGYARLLSEAARNLEATLGEWREHPPHYTLFLTFLKLLKLIQAELNRFTGRHLNYYYRDVLRLRPKLPAPDSAFITVELAKPIPNYLLPKGTLFRAGKDSAGQDVFYGLQKDAVFNKARVGRLMSVYRGSAKDDIGTVTNANRWFAAPVANSADAVGAELTSPQKEWHPYINRTYIDGNLETINQPPAQVGFAIASHYLALAEGRRLIQVRLSTTANAVLNQLRIDVFLTGPKGWFQAPATEIWTGVMSDGTSCAIIQTFLEPTAPAVVNYDAAVHGGTFGVTLPVIKVVLENVSNSAYRYETFRDLKVTKVEVEVDVGSTSATTFNAEGAKQLLLGSGAGSIDPAKPFLPFGPQPDIGATFIVGSREIFSKKGAKFRFHAEWLNPSAESTLSYTSSTPPTASLDFLRGGVWQNSSSGLELFGGGSAVAIPSTSTALSVPNDAVVSFEDPFEPYSNLTRSGFLRLRLDQTFGHKEYFAALTAYLIEQAKEKPDTTVTEPTQPYQPTLQSFLISYTASAFVNLTSTSITAFADRSLRFFHLYPFGEAEQHAQISGATSIYLLPQFRYVEEPVDTGAGGGADSSVALVNQAEFYVGLESVGAGEAVSILFQFQEGSSDPQAIKPDEHLYFSYLASNAWKAIRRNLVGDSTRQFIQSGLIELAIPQDATNANTLLPAGYIWLRFSVAEAPDAIAKIISVLPQAALVTYQPTALNAPDFPSKPLPSGSIAKLKEPLSAVKKVQQPYPSFRIGGSGETERLFQVRVSERLRHKDRAIGIWDYEHLVLQAFPQVHKAKCLSHTSLVPDPDHPGGLICNELAPGHVLVITLPNLANRNDANPLRPYTNADLLIEIQDYLRARVSCHAQVVVANPLFEELRMEFTVTLRKGYNDAAFYRKLLQEEITRFLTPWAFEDGRDIHFGGVVHKSSLIDFVEERDAVDFLTDVKLYHKAGDDAIESNDLDEVTASTARSILVSAPASKHAITVLLHEDAPVVEEECCTDE